MRTLAKIYETVRATRGPCQYDISNTSYPRANSREGGFKTLARACNKLLAVVASSDHRLAVRESLAICSIRAGFPRAWGRRTADLISMRAHTGWADLILHQHHIYRKHCTQELATMW